MYEKCIKSWSNRVVKAEILFDQHVQSDRCPSVS